MKHKFTKYLGRVTEILELGFEDKFIYVHYTKGNTEKTACILKNENKSEVEYLEGFFTDNNVSEEMRKDVRKFLKGDKDNHGEEWNEFTNFLMKTLSLNMVFGITIALTVFAFYKLGSYLDTTYSFYPMFTLIGTFFGIGIGGLTGYVMYQKYFKSPVEKQKVKNADESNLQNGVKNIKEYQIIDVSIEQVRKAVREFSENLPKGVYRTILIQEDNSIDFNQLADILRGFLLKRFICLKKHIIFLKKMNEKFQLKWTLSKKLSIYM